MLLRRRKVLKAGITLVMLSGFALFVCYFINIKMLKRRTIRLQISLVCCCGSVNMKFG